MIQALTLDLIYLKLLIVHIQLMTLKSFEPWYAMHVLFENTRFSLCIMQCMSYLKIHVLVYVSILRQRETF